MFPNMNQVLKIVYPRGQFFLFPSSAGWAPRLIVILSGELMLDFTHLSAFVCLLTGLLCLTGLKIQDTLNILA